MRYRIVFAAMGLLIASGAVFAQDMSMSELAAKVADLESRVAMLERIIIDLTSDPKVANPSAPSASIMKWRELRVGMSESAVRILLGEPLRINRIGPLATWYYSGIGWHSTVMFDRGGVFSWSEPD